VEGHGATDDGLLAHVTTDAEQRRRMRVLLEVSADLARRTELPVLLRRIVELAVDLVGARYGALGVIGPDQRLEQFVHVGIDGQTARRIGHLPEGKGLLGALIADPHPIRLPDLSADPRSAGFPAAHPPMSSFLGVPVQVGGEVFGNLYLAESIRGQFSDEDQDFAVALAASAGVAIENTRLGADRRSLALLDERARIARDLHDHVIQRLFAAGLNLQAAATKLPGEQADVVAAQVVEIDRAIAQIRETIHSLRSDPGREPRLRGRVLEVVGRAGSVLPHWPTVSFVGPVDLLIDGDLADDVVAVVSEAVSNAMRHASASTVSVEVAVDGESAIVTVTDDGCGIAADARWSGLANLRERAEQRFGALDVANGPSGGTVLRWTART
jgi:signal transduction histidine kinase